MEQRLSILTLGVSDLARARTFYDALGWRAANANSEEAAEVVAYNLNGFTLALYPRDKLADDAAVTMREGGFPPFALAYNVNSPQEVDAVLKHAETAGGTTMKPGQKAFWGGYSGYFSDPDGFLWEVAHNPFSRLKEDGSFQWSAPG